MKANHIPVTERLQNKRITMCLKISKKEFIKRMKIAVKLVNSWPKWKQNLLQYSMNPKVSVPRKPVINKRCSC